MEEAAKGGSDRQFRLRRVRNTGVQATCRRRRAHKKPPPHGQSNESVEQVADHRVTVSESVYSTAAERRFRFVGSGRQLARLLSHVQLPADERVSTMRRRCGCGDVVVMEAMQAMEAREGVTAAVALVEP